VSRGGARPNSGRKRKDPELKALAGTTRMDRETAVGEAAAEGPMICPLHLSDLAQLLFKNIASILEEQKRASPHYAEHVALLALRLEQIQRFQAVLETEGDTFTSESAKKVGERLVVTRLVRARPEVAMLSDAMRHAQSLLGELMLNPAAALRIASGHKPEEGAFDDF
jgi:phage terminase small subunit